MPAGTDRIEELIGTGFYADTGCEVAPSCLRCPLPQCRYDDHRWNLRANIARDEKIVAAHKDGSTMQAIADRFGLSKRQVIRIVVAARKEELVEFPVAVPVIVQAPEPITFGQIAFPWPDMVIVPKRRREMVA